VDIRTNYWVTRKPSYTLYIVARTITHFALHEFNLGTYLTALQNFENIQNYKTLDRGFVFIIIYGGMCFVYYDIRANYLHCNNIIILY